MPRFRFKALDAKGAVTSGDLVADTRADALEQLTRTQRTAIALDETQGSADSSVPWWQRDVFEHRELPLAELASFTRELASLTNASVPIDEVLRLMLQQPAVGARQKRITAALLANVTEGQSLSAAMAASRPGFPGYYTRLVEAGETGGTLASVLDDLANFLDRSAETRARIQSALVYPVVLLFAAIVAIAVVTGVLVPAVEPIFADAGVAPPLVIRTLSAIERFLSEYWLAASVTVVGLLALVLAGLRDARVRTLRDQSVLKLPVLGRLTIERETARIARTLSALVRNSVPLTEAVRSAGAIVTNRVLAAAIDTARRDIEEGSTASAAFQRSGLFPDLFVSLTRVGEETGQLGIMLARVADTYDALVTRRVERLMTLLTPVLTLLIGGFVGLLIISVMNAILSINDLVLP